MEVKQFLFSPIQLTLQIYHWALLFFFLISILRLQSIEQVLQALICILKKYSCSEFLRFTHVGVEAENRKPSTDNDPVNLPP